MEIVIVSLLLIILEQWNSEEKFPDQIISGIMKQVSILFIVPTEMSQNIVKAHINKQRQILIDPNVII